MKKSFLLLFFLLFTPPQLVFAHAQLEQAIPVQDSQHSSSPPEIRLTFIPQ